MADTSPLLRSALRARLGGDELYSVLHAEGSAERLAQRVTKRLAQEAGDDVEKFNPNHGPDGRFTSGSGGGGKGVMRHNSRPSESGGGTGKTRLTHFSTHRSPRKHTGARWKGIRNDLVARKPSTDKPTPSVARAKANLADISRDYVRATQRAKAKAKVKQTRGAPALGNKVKSDKPTPSVSRAKANLADVTRGYTQAVNRIQARRAKAAKANREAVSRLVARSKKNKAVAAKRQATMAGKAKLRALIRSGKKSSAGKKKVTREQIMAGMKAHKERTKNKVPRNYHNRFSG